MHAYRYREHEERVADAGARARLPPGLGQPRVSPLIKLVGRGDTTVVDGYLSPILRRYVAQVAGELDPPHKGAARGSCS